ncbi:MULTISPECIES: SAF domain-containing protein [Rhodococcus]|uniref:Flagella basal body P-ring formation protein FlgA n=1 Tax=Rhodococcus pseudokoreensis TaxID=2811421 RepID=A0A974ZR47_9NOCA|nr:MULTISPECIES: SAF domain-containing protein [Rhodococcus]MDV6246246.1 SAF domain-containing protein [Rhodococcus opacus]QSE87141.1 flagella basal body P-ring formation protein FlgA [Rhodococcus pseudokoreensis]
MGITTKIKDRALSKAIGEEQDTTRNGTAKPDADFTATSRTKVRRRPAFLAAGIALCVVFVVGAVVLVNGLRHVTEVLVVSNGISQGEKITSDDLTTVQINSDANVSSIPIEQKNAVIGKSAAVTLPAGTVLNPNAITEAVIPGKGLTVVGITASYAKLPAQPLQPGDMVRVVDTPRDQDDAPVQGPIATKAQVVSTKEIPETGEITVDVIVPDAEGSWVSARAATGRVSIVLDSSEK